VERRIVAACVQRQGRGIHWQPGAAPRENRTFQSGAL